MRLMPFEIFKQQAEINGNEYDLLAEQILESVSEDIQSYLNRKLKLDSYTDKFNGGIRNYWLSAYPVDDGQTFTVVDDGNTLTKDEDYWLRAETGELDLLLAPNTFEPQILSVTYTGGYAFTQKDDGATENAIIVHGVPEDIKLACFIQASYLFRRRRAYGIEVSAQTGNRQGLTAFEGMREIVPEAKHYLKKHRRLADQK